MKKTDTRRNSEMMTKLGKAVGKTKKLKQEIRVKAAALLEVLRHCGRKVSQQISIPKELSTFSLKQGK